MSQFVFDILRELDPQLAIQVKAPPRPGCLGCPPSDLLAKSVLGGIVRESMALASDYRRGKRLAVKEVHTMLRVAAPRALGALVDRWMKDVGETRSRMLALAHRCSRPQEAD